MARGQRRTIEEKIAAKQEIIESLLVRVESEKKELRELQEEKKRKELEVVSDLIEDAGLEPEEVMQVLQNYIDNRQEDADEQEECAS